MKINEISKYISLILRHKPEEIGITLDEHGWANLRQIAEHYTQNYKNSSGNPIYKIIGGNHRFKKNAPSPMRRKDTMFSAKRYYVFGKKILCFQQKDTMFLSKRYYLFSREILCF